MDGIRRRRRQEAETREVGVTGIILVIVGILLAAAAALMVVFYGGDAYNAGNARAAANTIVNLGENVRHAVDLYKMQEGANPTDPQALVASGYLTAMPDMGTLGKPSSTWRTVQAAGPQSQSYVIDDVDERICDEINKRSASTGDTATGCVEESGKHLFYTRIGRW
jgi:type II secretory pathway pseudopilin PulG